jgi:predicted secreted protein
VVHPATKQRFTAAHELLHHRRDREAVVDNETEWIARGEDRSSDRERLAEAFAAWFLMPKRLVETNLIRLGVRLDQLQAVDAYELALAMGTSYAATVHHIANMRLISAGARDELLRVPPKRIKRDLGAPGITSDSRRDIRLVRLSGEGGDEEVRAEQGDAVIVEVPEMPSSGYLWEAAVPPGFHLVGDDFQSAEQSHSLGPRGRHRFLVRLDSAGRRVLRFEMRHPWEAATTPAAETVQLGIFAEATPAPGIVEPKRLVGAAT